MAREGYNGWANWETWNVALWIDNEPASYHEARSMAHDCWEDAEGCDERMDEAKRDLASKLKEWVPEAFTDIRVCLSAAGPGSDLLQGALGEVDWDEIAAHFLDELKEEGELSSDDDDDDDEAEEPEADEVEP